MKHFITGQCSQYPRVSFVLVDFWETGKLERRTRTQDHLCRRSRIENQNQISWNQHNEKEASDIQITSDEEAIWNPTVSPFSSI